MDTMQVADVERPPTLETVAGGRSWTARLAAFDTALMRRLTSIALPKGVSAPLIFLVRIGDGWLWALIALFLWQTSTWLQFRHIVVHCMLAVAISLAFYWPVKLITRRQRPFDLDPGVSAKVPPLDKYSFPSGHTMNNLAVALTLAIYVPSLYLPALLAPLALGGLRVLFGVHFLTDIVGGALLGGLSYVIAKHAFVFLPF